MEIEVKIFLECCEEGNLDDVKRMLISSPEMVNCVAENDVKPLHIVSANGHVSL